ncbi:MAG: hypothetical protein JO132_06610 [Streptosporangiaceae bacterium]|nr:hypothetical protein [Streptosporangiaceae bacterium]
MSTAVAQPPPGVAATGNGGVPARRAVIRWSWRLFRREWRQQLLVLALIAVAVAATIIGAAVATNTPPPANAGFGTAQDMATFPGSDPHLAAQIAALRHRFGRTDVIENQTIAIPGTVTTFSLRAQDPHGSFGGPMLSLVSGRYPGAADQVAVTSGVASAFNLKTGDVWTVGGAARRVTGIVANPQSLLDEFALVLPGQVTSPTQVTVLFDAPGMAPASIGPNVSSVSQAQPDNTINPETISVAAVTVGMLLIALVAVGGFTVLAQRRLRSVGMLASIGATPRHVRLVVRANGVITGVAGAACGLVLGLAGWLAYRPSLQASAHHLIGAFQLPWLVIVLTVALAVIATYAAASRPARAVSRIPVVTALAGRPAPPKRVRRSAVPGLVLLLAAFVLFGLASSGGNNPSGGSQSTMMLELAGAFVALIVAIVLLTPFCLSAVARLGRRAPVSARLALRDLSRYRARSGSALAAISLGVLIAAIVCVEIAARYGNYLDYVGPNLNSNQVIVYTPSSGPPGSAAPSGPASRSGLVSLAADARRIAAGLGSTDVIALDQTSASLWHASCGRQWSGQVYVATPQLLAAFGIKASQVDPAADILTMRPGISGMSGMQLTYGNFNGTTCNLGQHATFSCPKSDCLANPVIQQVSALPPGTSAPNTVITEHAIARAALKASTAGWLIQAPHPPTAAQITNARLTAAAAGMTIETRNSVPSSSEILNYASVFGVVLALAILAMTIGLVRSETAGDLRTLTATGASSWIRRTLTATTAGALAMGGALLGTAAAYLAAVAYARNSSLDGLSSLGNVPVRYLLLILVGMPLIAAVGGWLLAGRQPAAISRQPLE